MATREELLQAIAASEREIEAIEQKRLRSQSALMESFVEKTEPDEGDVGYFKVLSELIKLERERLRSLKAELEELK